MRQQVTPADLLSGARKLPAVCGEPLVPSCQHEAGGAVDGCGSGRRQPGIGNSLGVGLDGDDPASVQLVADGRDECAGDLVAVWSGNDLEAGDDPRRGRIGQAGIPVPDHLGARVGRDRPELRPSSGNGITARIGPPGEHAVRTRQAGAGQGLADEVGHEPAVLRVTPGAERVEDSNDAHVAPVLSPI